MTTRSIEPVPHSDAEVVLCVPHKDARNECWFLENYCIEDGSKGCVILK